MQGSNRPRGPRTPFRKSRVKDHEQSWGNIAGRSALVLVFLFTVIWGSYQLIVFGDIHGGSRGSSGGPVSSLIAIFAITVISYFGARRVYEDVRYKLSGTLPDRLEDNVTEDPRISESLDQHTHIRTRISLLNRTGIKVTAETVYGKVYFDRAGKVQVEWELASEHFHSLDKRHLTDPHVEVKSGDCVSTTCFRSDTREPESPSCAGLIWANHRTGEVSSPTDKKLTEVVVWGLTMMGFSGLHLLQYAFCMGMLFACVPAGYVYIHLSQPFPATETAFAGLAGIAFGVLGGRRLLFSGKPKAIKDFIAFARVVEQSVKGRAQGS